MRNPISYPQLALCNHYKTVETRNQSSHQSFCPLRRSHADNSIALVSISTPLFLAELDLFFPTSATQSNHNPSVEPHLSPSCCAERVREHQPHHVSGQPAAGVGSLRIPADQADLRPAGEGVEGLRRSTGWTEHTVRDVGQLPPEMWPGELRKLSLTPMWAKCVLRVIHELINCLNEIIWNCEKQKQKLPEPWVIWNGMFCVNNCFKVIWNFKDYIRQKGQEAQELFLNSFLKSADLKFILSWLV